MSISLGFILSFVPVALTGSLLLRWFQLSFLYNNMEKYWSDIGITLGVTILLLIISSIIVCLKLKPFDVIINRISSEGVKATAEEKKTVYQNPTNNYKNYDTCVLHWIFCWTIGCFCYRSCNRNYPLLMLSIL